MDWTLAILGRSFSVKPGTRPTVSGARGGDIQQFVDGVDNVVGEPRPRCRASSA
jgi:hypothetical protein